MTEKELREIAGAIWERFNAHDSSDLDERIAPDFVNHNALEDTPPGPEGQRQVNKRLWTAFPDMRFEIEEIFVAEDRFAVLGWMSGTQEGQFGSFPPKGGRFQARQVHTFRVNEDRQLTEHLAVRDDVAMLQQLGHLPSPRTSQEHEGHPGERATSG